MRQVIQVRSGDADLYVADPEVVPDKTFVEHLSEAKVYPNLQAAQERCRIFKDFPGASAAMKTAEPVPVRIRRQNK